VDRRRIVSGRYELLHWAAGAGSQVGGPVDGHASGVTSVAYSRDGHWIVSGSYDTALRLWRAVRTWPELLCSKLTANVSHKQWHNWVCPGLPVPAD
jgi:WD40 repeat protein